MVAATLTGPVAAAAPIAPAKDVHIKITDNIREAVGTLDVQFAIVVDKHNHIHVFTVSALKHPAEAEAENPPADDESPGTTPRIWVPPEENFPLKSNKKWMAAGG